MATWSNQSRNSSTFLKFLRHGTEPTLAELAAYTFESVVFQDGTQLQNVTFDQLAEQVWTLTNRN